MRFRSLAMITGYKDEGDNVFCAACWKTAKGAGGAASILDSEDPADPGNVFWVVDKCKSRLPP